MCEHCAGKQDAKCKAYATRSPSVSSVQCRPNSRGYDLLMQVITSFDLKISTPSEMFLVLNLKLQIRDLIQILLENYDLFLIIIITISNNSYI